MCLRVVVRMIIINDVIIMIVKMYDVYCFFMSWSIVLIFVKLIFDEFMYI